MGKIKLLIDESDYRCRINDGMKKTIKEYNFINRIKDYERVFCEETKKLDGQEKELTKEEKIISRRIVSVFDKDEIEKRRLEAEEQEWQRRDIEWRKNLTISQRIYLKIRYILIGR